MQQRTHGGFTAPELPANKARQGRWGVHGFTILAVSLVLVGLVWMAVEFYGQAIDTESAGAPATAVQSGALTAPSNETAPATTQ
ncbi:MAG: hypothetical protein JNK47_04385 [Mesorhizobium sp.]|nr:hypothetical protein [Mesorhizobium sp.]MBL8576441.1 hypothetical protein [Mesorhizobium sp.]